MTSGARTSHVAHLLPGYAAGTLIGAERDVVQAHVSFCSACQAELAEWQVIRQAMRSTSTRSFPTEHEGLDELLHRIDAIGDGASTGPLAARAIAPIAIEPHQLRRESGGRPLAHLATAALILLTLAGSLFVIGMLWRQESPSTVLPAISGTPGAHETIQRETLIDKEGIAVPNGPATIYTIVAELQPGVSSALGGQVGTMVYRVERGTMEISHSGVNQVVAAGEQWGAPVNGEAAFQNIGDDVSRVVEVDVLDSILTSSLEANYASKYSDPQAYSESFVISAAADLPGGLVRVVLDRVTLEPGAALPAFTKSKYEWLGIAEGRLGVTLTGDRLPFRWDSGEERTFGLRQSLPTFSPGTEVTLRNAGKETLVLYLLALIPVDAEDSLAAPLLGPSPPPP